MPNAAIARKLSRVLRRHNSDRSQLASGDGNSTLPRVSVVIPTYNRSQLLRRTVDSVLEQTYPRIEVVVVDDGSTDGTAEVMAEYTGRVTYLKQANQGVVAARNNGIQAASGDHITCLDDDDLILPAKIESQVRLLSSRPEVGLVHCRFYYADEDGVCLYKSEFLPEGDVLHELAWRNFVWSGAPLIRRRCFEKVGLFDERVPSVTADWDMWLRIAQAGHEFACVQVPLGVYRIHRDGMMSNVAELERGILAVLERTFSDPQLAADVAALKERAFANFRSWISCRYYAAGKWDDAQRNLTEALTLDHDLRTRPAALVRLFSDDALGARVGDPFGFVTNVLDHLPPCADDLRRYRSQILSRIYAGLAMRSYNQGHIAHAKSQLAEAIALDPKRFDGTAFFARLLTDSAMYLPVNTPLLYADTVLENLPAQALGLKHVRARVIGEINAKLAYEDYLAGQQDRFVRRFLTALRYGPLLVRKRSRARKFLKSLRR